MIFFPHYFTMISFFLANFIYFFVTKQVLPILKNFLNPPLHGANDLPPSSIEVKEYAFVAWCLITHDYNFTFTIGCPTLQL